VKPDHLEYLIEIKEAKESFVESADHSACRACERPDSLGVTWTIYLLARCTGGCGCRILIDHLDTVHDSTGSGDWEGTYTTPAEIGDPALRRYAVALLSGVQPAAEAA